MIGENFAADSRKQKVLIVDDSEMNRTMLEDILEDDYDIIQAENGVQAVAVLKERHFEIALVMLDMVMPEMDGLGVLEVMNKQHWIDNIPVIMISVESSAGYIEHAYDLGVTDYIKRPFDAFSVRRRVINTIMLYANQKKLVGLVADQIYEKEKSTNLMINILSHIVEFRNGESGLHVIHVQNITRTILEKYAEKYEDSGLTEASIATISLASSLHDIGKISIPESILNKPGKLTDEEFAIMKTHSSVGASMLESLSFGSDDPLIKTAYEISRWHHERHDGRGYPDRLEGDKIPLSAQVVSVADVYDALTSERVYKKAFSHEKAMEMILGGECGAFNPRILECLKDTAGVLKENLNRTVSEHLSPRGVKNITEEVLKNSNLNTAGTTFNSLENEIAKYKFLRSVSREMQFEYSCDPSILNFPERSAKKLGLPENITDPKNDEGLKAVISEKCVGELTEAVLAASPDQPIAEYECDINIGGETKHCKIVCISVWSDDGSRISVTGKIFDTADDMEVSAV
ncbi:MAG: response regulator [Prevotella sp.]|nr:response regulator [Prevotella sp.]